MTKKPLELPTVERLMEYESKGIPLTPLQRTQLDEYKTIRAQRIYANNQRIIGEGEPAYATRSQ